MVQGDTYIDFFMFIPVITRYFTYLAVWGEFHL